MKAGQLTFIVRLNELYSNRLYSRSNLKHFDEPRPSSIYRSIGGGSGNHLIHPLKSTGQMLVLVGVLPLLLLLMFHPATFAQPLQVTDGG